MSLKRLFALEPGDEGQVMFSASSLDTLKK